MARDAAPTHGYSGLYATLGEREELAARNGGLVTEASGRVYVGNADRLAAFRTGAPAEMRAGDLPPSVREGDPTHWWRRAIVTAAVAVSFHDDDGSAWLAENGL
ncbi:hypothetical protein ACGFK1_11755 [Mycobacterium sp. NPDC048908]|uniref:hypothetical protein n=1 Tax=Mycobacterium sp. NPDC048908 TaxID=3364292 RepID=UPI003721666F